MSKIHSKKLLQDRPFAVKWTQKCKKATFDLIKHRGSSKMHFCFEVKIYILTKPYVLRCQSADFAISLTPICEGVQQMTFNKIKYLLKDF